MNGKYMFLHPDKEVRDDRLYYRRDKEDIQDILSDPRPVRLVLGLRRYGKTSFLRRLERYCQPDGEYRNWKSYFVSAADSKFIVELKKARYWFEANMAGEDPGPHLILIDDLMQLETAFKMLGDSADKDRFLSDFREALQGLWNAARESDGLLKIILAEPTCFDDWLKGENGQLGASLGDVKRMFHVEERPPVIPALKEKEVFSLLRADQRDLGKPALPDVSYDLALILMQETGGNPWLLAHAQEVIWDNKHLLKTLSPKEMADKVVENVKGRARLGESNQTLFDTIYGSLSRTEQFILRYLAENEENPQLAATMTPFQGIPARKSVWRDEAMATFSRMEELGLIETKPGTKEPARIRSSFIRERLKKLYGNQPLILCRDPLVREKWKEVLKTDPFRPPSAAIIHQFSDVLFSGDKQHDSWRKYITYVASLPAEDRPHLVIFCGNLLAAPQTSLAWESATERMSEAFNELLEYLQPADRNLGGYEYVNPNQIIVVPGIYDRIWSAEKDRHPKIPQNASYWTRMLAGEGMNLPIHYRIPDIVIIPIDTIATADVENGDSDKEQTGFKLRKLRSHLSERFKHCWDEIADNENLSCTEAWELFTKDALFYASSRRENDIDDFGYVSPKTLNDSLKLINNAVSRSEWHDPIVIAITHHFPHQHYTRNDLAFHGYFQLRKHLLENGVPILLHGHSPLQTCLSKTIRKWRVDKTPFHMIGSGSFWPTAIFYEQRCGLKDPPTFNSIRIECQDSDPESRPKYYNVQIKFGSIENDQIELSPLTATLPVKGKSRD